MLYTELARGSSGWGIGSVDITAVEGSGDSKSNSKSNGSERNLIRRSSDGSIATEDVLRDGKSFDMVLAAFDERRPVVECAPDLRVTASSAELLLFAEGDGCFRMPRNGCGLALGSTSCASENGFAADPCARLSAELFC